MKEINRASFHLGILVACMLLGGIVEYFIDFQYWPALFTIAFICPYIACVLIGYLTFWEPNSLVPTFSAVKMSPKENAVLLKSTIQAPLAYTMLILAFGAIFLVASIACLAFPLFSFLFIMGFTFSDGGEKRAYTLWPAKIQT